MGRINRKYWVLFFVSVLSISCKNSVKDGGSEGDSVVVETPVTVTGVSDEPLRVYIELNATSAFLQKSFVKANAGGYLKAVQAQLGKYVLAGDPLFTLKTKEAQSIGNAILKLDPSFKFSGENNIKATATGYVTQLNHQAGDYVQDGEQLAVISDMNSFAFVLELPYELRTYVLNQKTVKLTLADGMLVDGTIEAAMPTVDPSSQTQNVIIRVPDQLHLPENLIAKVRVLKAEKKGISIPRAALLSNDIQSEYWVMKMIDSNTAVKVPVTKGLETKDRVELLSPTFSPSDKILLNGNFGLGDTAKVKIMQP